MLWFHLRSYTHANALHDIMSNILFFCSSNHDGASYTLPDGDLPLHLACYEGQAPPEIIQALIDAYPESVRKSNKMGRDPLELAARNYRIGHPHRAAVLALLRWHRPENSTPTDDFDNEVLLAELPGIFSDTPPDQMYSTSVLCVVCMEEQGSVVMLPCGGYYSYLPLLFFSVSH